MAQTHSITGGYVFSEVAAETITGAKLNRMMSEGYVSSTSGVIETGNIADQAITLVKVAPNTIDGTVAKNVGDQDVIAGQMLVYKIVVPNSSTDLDITVTHKVQVIDVWATKTSTLGASGDAVKVQNSANEITTTALDLNVADSTVARATVLSDANSTIAAAGTLRINPTSVSNCECEVFVQVIRVA